MSENSRPYVTRIDSSGGKPRKQNAVVRVCEELRCSALLSKYNEAKMCYLHLRKVERAKRDKVVEKILHGRSSNK